LNYFPFHLGDYAAHTGHLDPLEDLAYRRMIDAYYLREGPLPSDSAEVARLIRMRSNIAEVESVLKEFFTPSENGWSNSRCDDEIESMRDKQTINQNREAHEKDRMRRHRERRSQMFESLRTVGVVPAWDISMKDLQRIFEDRCNAPETHLKRGHYISDVQPATAIPTPTPTPTPKENTSLSTAKLPECPHDALIDLYASRLPELPQPRRSLWRDGKNGKALKSRWCWLLTAVYETGERAGSRMAETEADGLAWFDRYFAYVAKSDFLTGKNSEWTADLGWLVNRANFEKVLQGNYENKKGTE